MPLPSIDIELSSPQSVGGRPAAYQSLWLLVRLHHAQRSGDVVALDALRGQVSSARTLRMVVSRAFRDFKAWGLRVGWGPDTARDPRFLNAEGRSQGPFWLPAAEARRLRLRVDGQAARPADVAAFLGLSASPRRAHEGATADARASAVQLQDARFWHQLAAAQQAMRQGRWAAPVQGRRDAKAPTSALAAMRQAADLAQDDYQRALVTLNEALLWRRLGDDAQARKRLAALQRQRLARQVASHDYLGAMAAIVGAWCSYTARDLPQAQAQLAAMTRDAQQAPLLRHHPQVRFEWSNLWALACRSRALGLATTDAATATLQADEAMAHFGRALAAAFESHAFDAAQHVAANMGMAVWLFDRVGLGVQAAARARGAQARRHAVQWIAFSEWLCSLADGHGRSAWNAIYLMRIARGDCQPRPGLPLAEFAALRPLTPRALAEESAEDRLAPSLDGPATRGGWAGVAAQHLADHDAGQRRYPGLQLAGLLFEQAWFAAHGRDLGTAAAALARLRAVLPQLVASDRAYFRDVWNDALPAELLALEPPPRRAVRRAAMG